MAHTDSGKATVIQEGNVRKGGSNTAPTSSHPATTIQGFGPTSSSPGGTSQPTQGSQSNPGSK